MQRMLRDRSMKPSSIQWVQSLTEANDALQQNQFDLIMTDLGLPDSTGVETVVLLRGLPHRLPIIALTGQDDEGLGLDAIRAGADDYIPKVMVSRPIISRAIEYSIERFRMAEEIMDANRLLESKNARLDQMYQMSQQFVDNVSHEFRTPLTVIREFAAIVRDGIDGPVTAKQQARLSTLIHRTDDLANMVDDLLDTSRLEAGLLKTCRQEHDLSEIIGQVEKMLQKRAKTKKISLQVRDILPGLAVYCDEEKLRRVLINLLVNAIKFTPVEGKVEISVARADKDRVSITVADNGPGIPDDDLKRIFERFQQVEAHHRMASCRGFGLGLSIARALASLNLGSLQVASEEGRGSEFSVIVPIARLDSVLSCYLDQRAATQEESGEISLIEVVPECLDFEEKDEGLETIDDFLRTSVKTFDLVLKTHDARWLVYTCNSSSSLTGFQKRIAKEWEQLRRNHYGAALPDLIQNIKMTVDVHDGRDELMNSLMAVEPHSAEPSTNENGMRRILVVDDELEVVDAIESRLRADGFDVATAHDGLTGLKAARQMQPDAILLDVRMPQLDGLAVLRQLKSESATAATPVVVLSASLHDRQTALDGGANFFIQKPYRSKPLIEALDSAMKKPI